VAAAATATSVLEEFALAASATTDLPLGDHRHG